MKKVLWITLLTAAIFTIAGCSPGSAMTKQEKIAAIDTMAAGNLQMLYAQKPDTKNEIKNAVGYACFSNASVNIIYFEGGGGYGVVVDNKTGKRTYMKMARAGLGLGLGAKDFRQVMVFQSRTDMQKFIDSGWEFGGQADAAAKASDKGGEASGEGFIGDTKVYSMTETGLALQATLTGTKYFQDEELN